MYYLIDHQRDQTISQSAKYLAFVRKTQQKNKNLNTSWKEHKERQSFIVQQKEVERLYHLFRNVLQLDTITVVLMQLKEDNFNSSL